jgi:hypothetical protein
MPSSRKSPDGTQKRGRSGRSRGSSRSRRSSRSGRSRGSSRSGRSSRSSADSGPFYSFVNFAIKSGKGGGKINPFLLYNADGYTISQFAFTTENGSNTWTQISDEDLGGSPVKITGLDGVIPSNPGSHNGTLYTSPSGRGVRPQWGTKQTKSNTHSTMIDRINQGAFGLPDAASKTTIRSLGNVAIPR